MSAICITRDRDNEQKCRYNARNEIRRRIVRFRIRVHLRLSWFVLRQFSFYEVYLLEQNMQSTNGSTFDNL